MRKVVFDYLLKDVWFYILAISSVAFLIAGFCVPPMGVIDGSVLTGVGELFAWGVLGTVIKAIDKGISTTLKHNDTELTIGNQDIPEE